MPGFYRNTIQARAKVKPSSQIMGDNEYRSQSGIRSSSDSSQFMHILAELPGSSRPTGVVRSRDARCRLTSPPLRPGQCQASAACRRTAACWYL